MAEILSLRQENSKTHDMGGGKRQLTASMGALHYKDNYASGEPWKDIDLTWVDNKITKAPYELTLEGKKITIWDKKSGEISTIELQDIGGKSIPDKAWEKSKGLARATGIVNLENIALDTDLEVVAENGAVRFTRVMKSDKAPKEAKFKVTGNFRVQASDADGELPVVSTLKDGILTESLGLADRPIKYPVRIDPTWQVGASTDDCYRELTSNDWGLTYSYFLAGANGVTAYQYGGGMRFTSITITAGAVITSAYLVLRASFTISGEVVNTRISAEDVDDAVTFADDRAAFDTRWAARTTARVDWDAIPAWTGDADYNSPEIKTVIQEVVDRGSWASGNDIVIFWEDFDGRSTRASNCYRAAYPYDSSTTYCPQLVITYTVPPTPQSVGDGAIAIAGALGLLTKVGVGSGTVTPTGALGLLTKISVGAGSIAISGSLERLIKLAVGAGSVAIAGALGLKTLISVGGGAVSIAGALGRKIKIAVGAGAVTIVGTLIFTIFRILGIKSTLSNDLTITSTLEGG